MINNHLKCIIFLVFVISTAFGQNFSGYDNNGEYVYGKVREEGIVTGKQIGRAHV